MYICTKTSSRFAFKVSFTDKKKEKKSILRIIFGLTHLQNFECTNSLIIELKECLKDEKIDIF